MKLPYIVLLLATAVSSLAQAEPLVNIPAGAAIQCAPSPSIKVLNERFARKIVSGFTVTCRVPGSQAAPAGSLFVGKQVAGSAADPYAFQWEMLRLDDGTVITWDNTSLDYPSTVESSGGQLQLTFGKNLVR